MEDRVARLEANCAGCPIRLVDVVKHQEDITALKVSLGRMEEMLDNINHWIHNGGNPAETEIRLRRLEQWRYFMIGAGATASVVFSGAIAALAILGR